MLPFSSAIPWTRGTTYRKIPVCTVQNVTKSMVNQLWSLMVTLNFQQRTWYTKVELKGKEGSMLYLHWGYEALYEKGLFSSKKWLQAAVYQNAHTPRREEMQDKKYAYLGRCRFAYRTKRSRICLIDGHSTSWPRHRLAFLLCYHASLVSHNVFHRPELQKTATNRNSKSGISRMSRRNWA